MIELAKRQSVPDDSTGPTVVSEPQPIRPIAEDIVYQDLPRHVASTEQLVELVLQQNQIIERMSAEIEQIERRMEEFEDRAAQSDVDVDVPARNAVTADTARELKARWSSSAAPNIGLIRTLTEDDG